MFKGLWQWIKDNAIEPITNLFRTQEEIDQKIIDDLSKWGTVVESEEIPAGATQRKNVFLSHKDAIQYIKNGGIPADYVFIVILPNWDDEGNDGYSIWVVES